MTRVTISSRLLRLPSATPTVGEFPLTVLLVIVSVPQCCVRCFYIKRSIWLCGPYVFTCLLGLGLWIEFSGGPPPELLAKGSRSEKPVHQMETT